MRGVRIRAGAGAVCVALLAVAAGGCRLVPGDDDDGRPVRVGTTDTVSALDPAGAYDAGSWALYGNVYQSLLTFAPGSSTPVPDAARSCTFKGEGLRTYTCTLRRGLRFANGHALTSRDVKFSFDRIARIKSPQGPGPVLETLESVAAPREDEVVFRLKVPDATFPFKIATGAGSIVDSDAYPADRLRKGDGVDGSGPYVLAAYRSGASAELEPNKRYAGAVKGSASKVTIRYFADSGRMSEAWRQRSVDVVGRQMPPADLADVSLTDSGVRVSETAAANMRSLVFNLRDGSPVKPLAVRQAAAAVIDRDALARDVHLRTVEPLYSLIPRGLTGHTTSFYDLYPQPDPGRARQILQRAGVAVPVRFGIAYSRGAATDQEAALLKEQLEATGLFEVTTRKVEWTAFQEGYARGAYDAYCVSWVADFPDPETFTSPLVGAESALHSGYESPRVEKLIRTAQEHYQRDRASGDFRNIQRIVAEDVPLVPLWQKKDYALSTSSISGAEYLSDGTGIWRLWRLHRI
ncbi:peptide-binding protein [Streptomyces cinnamoneus]|uniref:Peptide-binding protein n=1 Tax=Streptomyces cinnamoneus TaxID=53446 RepID=A0A2G1XEN5_STRCJ|nr:ABC transporter substrate-binding protein [Streptomyces cinnamoneus]PHQ49661.1 peptide-binding protein [Streptomyces cinnamoneus]PPT14617.1 peptide-binding protein [Streptomyces cinnamoneus]